MTALILPGDPLFNLTLATSRPPNWQEVAERSGDHAAYVACSASGILRPVDRRNLDEYVFGGEYDDRLADLEGENDELDSTGIYHPDDQLVVFT